MPSLDELDPDCFELDYEDRIAKVRGSVIAHFAKLEKILEGLLAAEFSADSEDRRRLQNIVFDRMTFEGKRTTLKTLLMDRAIREGFQASKKKGHPHKKLIDELTYLNAVRNQFAHYPSMQATTKLEYSYAIGIIEYRDNPNCKWFTKQEIDTFIERIEAVKKEIAALTKRR